MRSLISGPDLGGGYLHQLSRDLEDGRATFTHHAQEGGADAGGPPKGPLDGLDFVHPPAPCMFGGPRCYHRVYALPDSETARVRAAYQRYRFVLSTLLDQRFAGVAPAAAAGLGDLIRAVREPMEREGLRWYLAGPTSAWLQGAAPPPETLQIGGAEPTGARLSELLREYLIEPWAPTDWAGRPLRAAARAFLGTPREGIRAEWWAPPSPRPGDLGELGEYGEAVRTVLVDFEGHRIPVTRLEYAGARAFRDRREEDLRRLGARIPPYDVDAELLAELARRIG
ncbi:MAG: hypothetical protein ACYCPN_07460 [Thermoplasmata archaeon]